MKVLLVFLLASSFMACSSAKKQADHNQPLVAPPTTVAKEAPAAIPADANIIKTRACESDKDKRSLELRKKMSGCELSYSKFGKSKIVSSGKHGTKHCEDSFEKITKILEAQKFSCHPA